MNSKAAMERTYWHKQDPTSALYPDLVWSRPQSKRTAGKLLIIGGNAHGFAAAQEAYQSAVQAGIGTAKVLLPDSLQKLVGTHFEAAEFAASTPAGSFSQQALALAIDLASWADGVLLAGDLGRNSETAIFIEHFLGKYKGILALTKDAADYAINIPSAWLEREQTLFVISLAQLQKLFQKSAQQTAITFSMDLLHLVDRLHEFTENRSGIIVKHLDWFYAACRGQVSTT